MVIFLVPLEVVTSELDSDGISITFFSPESVEEDDSVCSSFFSSCSFGTSKIEAAVGDWSGVIFGLQTGESEPGAYCGEVGAYCGETGA